MITRRDGLGTSLVVTVGCIVLFTTLAVSLAGYWSGRSTIEREVHARVGDLTKQTLAATDNYLAARVEELRQMTFQQLQISTLSTQDTVRALFNYAGAFGSQRYADLTIVNTDGTVRVSTGSPAIDRAGSLVKTLNAATKPGVVDYTTFTDQTLPEMVVYAPLIDENGKRTGTLVGRLLNTELVSVVRGIPLEATTSVYLVHGADATPMAANGGDSAPKYADKSAGSALTDTKSQTIDGVPFTAVAMVDANAALQPVRDLTMQSVVVGIVVFLAGTLAAFWTARRIGAPVALVADAARRFSGGDLRSSVPIASLEYAELRDLGTSFNAMATEITSLIEGIRSASVTISRSVVFNLETALAVRSGTEEQAQASGQIAAALTEVAAGARRIGEDCIELEGGSRVGLAQLDALVAEVDGTNVALHQLTQTIDRSNEAGRALSRQALDVASRARDVRARAESAQGSATAGSSAVRGLVTDIQNVGKSLLDTVERLEHLADATAKAIQAQVAVINDMAERSKLLALNAGIEAARAGESGRGFAVIAGELHRLAGGSKTAGDEVSALVTSVVTETQALVKQAQGASQLARGAIDRAGQTGATIEKLVAEIDENARGAREIGRIAEEQAERTAEIEAATEDMRRMASITAAAATTVGELSRQVRGAVDFATSVATQVSQATKEQIETFAVIESSANEIERTTQRAAESASLSAEATHRLQEEVEVLVARVRGFTETETETAMANVPGTNLAVPSPRDLFPYAKT
jgi:methyl-accepting chemotaxis protein